MQGGDNTHKVLKKCNKKYIFLINCKYEEKMRGENTKKKNINDIKREVSNVEQEEY